MGHARLLVVGDPARHLDRASDACRRRIPKDWLEEADCRACPRLPRAVVAGQAPGQSRRQDHPCRARSAFLTLSDAQFPRRSVPRRAKAARLLPRLFAAMEGLRATMPDWIERRERIAAKSAENRATRAGGPPGTAPRGITKAYLSLKLGEALRDRPLQRFLRTRRAARRAGADGASRLVPGAAFRRAGMERSGRDGRPPRRPGAALCRRLRGRLLHVRQSDGLPPRCRSGGHSVPDGDRQQCRMGRGSRFRRRALSRRAMPPRPTGCR